MLKLNASGLRWTSSSSSKDRTLAYTSRSTSVRAYAHGRVRRGAYAVISTDNLGSFAHGNEA